MSVPVNSAAPTISGTIRAHETLTGASGAWSDGALEDQIWQFADDGSGTNTVDAGDTDGTFIADSTKEDLYVRYGETFSNGEGTSSYAYSSWYGPIAAAAYTAVKHYLCGTVEEIEAACNAINYDAANYGLTGFAIGILPGSYNLKSPYRKELEIDPASATIPSGATIHSGNYALYFSAPNVTIYAVIPGTVRLYGEEDAIVNSATTGSASAHRGGMVYVAAEAINFTIYGIDFDGSVPYSATFNVNNYCDKTDLGVDCWDLGHKAIYTAADNTRILYCKLHNWAGEMVYGGSDSASLSLEIAYCELYDNQVSAISGSWKMHCHHNEFYELYGQVMEGLHSRTCRYYDNHFHDCAGGGLNILGPVTALSPAAGWWVDIRNNVFENMTSASFGGVYVSDQATEDTDGPSRIAVVGNVFRDCRTVVSSSLGACEQLFFADNVVIVDAIEQCDGIASRSGSFDYSWVYNNVFMCTQNAVDEGAVLDSAPLDTGRHNRTQFAGNSYISATIPSDKTAGGDTAARLIFRDEHYENLAVGSLSLSSSVDPDVAIPRTATGVPISCNAFGLKFNSDLYLKMWTVDGGGDPYYYDGTEIRLVGNDSSTAGTTAYLIDGRGCQLVNGEPVFLAAVNDYILLRFNANIKLWVEVERSTPRADSLLKLAHRGLAADIPLLGSVRSMVVDSVNVIDQALWGWKYFETDTNILKIYTDSGWQTVWS